MKPNEIGAALQLALNHLQTAKLVEAESLARKVVNAMPALADGWHVLAAILHQGRDHAGAISAMERAVELDSRNASRHNDLGEMLRGAGRQIEAAGAYRRALELNPRFAMAHNNLGVCLSGMGDKEGARAEYEQAIAQDPQYGEAYFNLGSHCLDAGDLSTAEHFLKRACDLQPENPLALKLLGDSLLRQQRAEEALAFYEVAEKILPNDEELIVSMGKAYLLNKSWDKACICFQKAIEIKPDKAKSYFLYGEALKQSEKLDEAASVLRKAMHLMPRSHDIANNLSNILRTLGHLDEAEMLLIAATTWKPDNASIKNSHGMVLYEKGRIKESFDKFFEAVNLSPDFAEAHGNLANIYRNFGDFEQAKVWYQNALAIRPDYTSARFSLAITQLSLGEFTSGWANYRYRERALTKASWRFPEMPLEENLEGKRIFINYDQGIGDEIFFLRFAAELKRRGAWIAYRSFPKIATLLSRLPFIDTAVGGEDPPPHDIGLWVSDLAFAAGMRDDTPPPASITFRTTPGARNTLLRRLEELGQGPFLGVTWRAGLSREVVTQWRALYKDIPMEKLASCLRGFPGKILILQRNVSREEVDSFRRVSGGDVYDFSDLNDKLEQMHALLDVLDEHVCVSNTNVHLRAALEKTSRVLIPNPPDWRWMASGDESPWFPGCSLYRQTTEGDWAPALKKLRQELAMDYALGPIDDEVFSDPPAVTLPAVRWLVRDTVEYDQDGPSARYASTRYRVLIPMREMHAHGRTVALVTFENEKSWPAPEARMAYGVVSKTINPASLPAVISLKNASEKLVVDLCDNHFNEPELGPFYKTLVDMADVVVASTPGMAQVILDETGRQARVIGDPFEGVQGDVRFDPAARLKLLWFGRPVNLETLADVMPALVALSRGRPLALEVVTALGGEKIQEVERQALKANAEDLLLTVTKWSREATWRAMLAADLVLIPTLETEKKSVKSPNRLVEALWNGRFVVAGRLPAHEEFESFAWVGDDIAEGIRWALDNPEAVRQKIHAGQEYLKARYSPQVISARWEAVLAPES